MNSTLIDWWLFDQYDRRSTDHRTRMSVSELVWLLVFGISNRSVSGRYPMEQYINLGLTLSVFCICRCSPCSIVRWRWRYANAERRLRHTYRGDNLPFTHWNHHATNHNIKWNVHLQGKFHFSSADGNFRVDIV